VHRPVGAAATYEANVAEILPTVSFESFDLRFAQDNKNK